MPSVTVLHSNYLIRQLMYRPSCRFLCFIWSVISLIETSQQIPTPLGPEWSCGCHDCPGMPWDCRMSFFFSSLIRQFWAPRMVRIYQLARVWGFPTMGEGGWWYHILLFRNKSFFFFCFRTLFWFAKRKLEYQNERKRPGKRENRKKTWRERRQIACNKLWNTLKGAVELGHLWLRNCCMWSYSMMTLHSRI